MARTNISGTEAGRAIAAFGVLLLMLVWTGIGIELARDRALTLSMAEANTANLAHAFDEHVQRTVAGLDQSLLHLRGVYERDPAGFTLARALPVDSASRQVSLQFARIGANGVLADSNLPDFSPVDLTDREHFQIHRNSADVGLFISKPVLGRVSGRWSVQLSRRLNKPNGAFAGVMVISLDTRYLSDFYSSFDVGGKGTIMLVGRDGVVRAASDRSMGRSVPDHDLIERIFADGISSGTITGPLDDEIRVTSMRALRGLPFAVLVGRSEDDVLAPFYQTLNIHVMAGGLVSVLLVGALIFINGLVRRQGIIAHDLEVTKSELLASRERLRRYVGDLERIAEVAAHDLQEPLRRVVSYTQLLSSHAEPTLDQESRDYVAHVVAGARRMRKLVQDLEAFVAVDQLPPAGEPVPAAGALAAAAERLAEEVNRSGATLLAGPLPEVEVDDKSLTEIFTQLIDNALRYRSPERKPLIHVAAHRDGGVAVFSVRDNGAGIDARYLPRLFEIFHRLNAIDGQSGTGMGLAIVRRMVERLGGRVWVDSRLGEGSTFWFSLPSPANTSLANTGLANTSLDREVKAA